MSLQLTSNLESFPSTCGSRIFGDFSFRAWAIFAFTLVRMSMDICFSSVAGSIE